MESTAEDVVSVRSSTEIMECPLSPPPSYDDAMSVHRLPCESALEHCEDLAELATATAEKPPQAKWLVKSDKEPSYLKLLTGPIMSNAGGSANTDPLRKRRYRVAFPAGYEDVYLHKPTWASNRSTLPMYHVELLGRERYEPEPIVILGPADFHHDTLTAQSRQHAARHLGRVFCRVQEEIAKTTRYVVFCEAEFFGWDWTCKTQAAKQDMANLIARARDDCLRCAALALRLEQFLDFVGRDGKSHYEGVMKSIRRSLRESAWRLNRLPR